MMNLNTKYKNIQLQYRKIFMETLSELRAKAKESMPKGEDYDILWVYEENTPERKWQKNFLNQLIERRFEIKKEGSAKILEIKKQYNCICCGSCCRLACSEFSEDELIEKSKNGDTVAKEFLQIFVPYKSNEEVRKIFPEYLNLLEENCETGYYFYHCPKVTEDNKCSDYENRPKICADYPDNPLAFLPLKCGFNEWKLKSEPVSLKLSAEMEILTFYIDKIKGLYS